MANGIITPDAPPPLVIPDVGTNLEYYIGSYVKLRDRKAEIKKRHTEELRPYNDAMDLLENGFLKHLTTSGSDNAGVKGTGTIYRTTKRRATIEDGDAFRRHVIGAELWTLVDWRANAAEVHKAIVDTNYTVPGVKYSEDAEIGVRRA